MKDLREMTSKELKEMAKEMKISNWWNLKKEVLIAKIDEIQNMSDEEKQAIADQKAKEDAALKEYTKNWQKYTKRYNPIEFMQKFRSGEIILAGDEPETVEEPVEAPVEQSENEKHDNIQDEEENSSEDESEAQDDAAVEQPLKPKRGALIEFNGKAKNICAWGEELGISPNTLYGRIYKMNWSVERAFTTPARKSK